MPQSDIEDYQTKNYQVVLGSKEEGGEAIITYEVVNKGTGVTEYEDYLLPRVINTLSELQNRLDEAIEAFNNPQHTPKLSIAPGGKGGHTAH